MLAVLVTEEAVPLFVQAESNEALEALLLFEVGEERRLAFAVHLQLLELSEGGVIVRGAEGVYLLLRAGCLMLLCMCVIMREPSAR